MPPIAYLPEPPQHRQKQAFFDAVIAASGVAGVRLSPFAMAWRGFPETDARARDCLARAKKQPKNSVARAAKLAFLKGRYNYARRWFAAHPNHTALCWQGLTGTRRAVMLGAQDAGAATLFAELSPLPGLLALDPQGVNADGSVPQQVGFYDDITPDQPLLDQIAASFTARTPRRADVGQAGGNLPDTPYLFVPLQVPDDSQMTLFAGWVGSMPGFITALAQAARALPDGWHLRLKEHPSARTPLTDQIKRAIAAGAPIVLDNATDSFAQIAGSRGVLTVNSSMGVQAMFLGKPVIATGRIFWGLPGLAVVAGGADDLARVLATPDCEFDAALRARFLTWLAQRYYVPETGGAARVAARITGADTWDA